MVLRGDQLFGPTRNGLFKKKNGPTFCASSLLIQLFAMEHLPKMTKSLLGDDFQLPSRVPLAAEWTKLMKRFSHNTKSAELKLKNKFKVEHTPYKRFQDNKFKRSHPETWNNLKLCAGTFSCICLHRNEYYDYQRYNVQLGLPFMEVPDEGDIIRKSRKGVAAYFNFEDKSAADIKAWEEKEKTFISEIPYISSFKCSDDQQDEGAQNSPTGTSKSSFPDEPTFPLILPTTAHSSPHTPINHEDGLHGGNNRFLNDNFNVGGGEYDFQGDLVYVDDLQDDTRLEEMTQKPVVKRKRKRVNKSKKKRKVGKIYPVANRYTIDDTHDVERKVNSSPDKTELLAKWVLDRRGTIWIS